MGGVSVKQMEYNMRPFFEQCVDSYLTLTKKDISTLKPAKTPFLDETKIENSPSESKGLLAHCVQGTYEDPIWSPIG